MEKEFIKLIPDIFKSLSSIGKVDDSKIRGARDHHDKMMSTLSNIAVLYLDYLKSKSKKTDKIDYNLKICYKLGLEGYILYCQEGNDKKTLNSRDLEMMLCIVTIYYYENFLGYNSVDILKIKNTYYPNIDRKKYSSYKKGFKIITTKNLKQYTKSLIYDKENKNVRENTSTDN